MEKETNVKQLPIRKILIFSFVFFLLSFVMGIIYGVFAGFPLQTGMVTLTLTGVLVMVNTCIMLLSSIVVGIVRIFKRKVKGWVIYALASLALFCFYLPVFLYIYAIDYNMFD